jgi:branched-chain amino acid transport system ATP-binding protein
VTALLETDGLTRRYGALCAVDGVSLSIPQGARHALIGPNGAGKSTLFALLGGGLAPTAGTIRFDGRDVTSLPEYRRVRLGMARTFQHSAVFLRETVLENTLVLAQRRAGVAWSMLRPALRRRHLVERCMELLSTVGLADRPGVLAGALSHGERRQLEVAMALALEPRLLLLDEPAAGMSAAETARLSKVLSELPAEMTVLLIEHDLDVVFDLADTVTVLHLGRHLMTGSSEQVRASAEVQAAYLGAADSSELFPSEAAS